MKKSLCFAFVFVFLAAVSAKAVVIHWAVSTMPVGTKSAQLVYVASGTPAYSTFTGSLPTPSSGTQIGDEVIGLAVTPKGIGEQNTVDIDRSAAGNYYVVLFNSDYTQFNYSSALGADNGKLISLNETSPADSTFDPASFSGWTTVPEPGSAAMLALGLGLLALRRRKLS